MPGWLARREFADHPRDGFRRPSAEPAGGIRRRCVVFQDVAYDAATIERTRRILPVPGRTSISASRHRGHSSEGHLCVTKASQERDRHVTSSPVPAGTLVVPGRFVPLVRFSSLSSHAVRLRSRLMQQEKKTSQQNPVKSTHALVALAIALAPTLTYAQTLSGTLDASFGTGGKVTTDFAGSTDGANAIALQPDGKLVAVGGAA